MSFKYLFIVLLVVLASCKKDDKKIYYGYHCFPMTEGHYVIYDVIDIFHDIALLPQHDTNRYQIKEVIGEEEIDGENQPYRKLYRYKRDNDTLNWNIKDVWTIKRTKQTAEIIEENKRRINLAFSISYDRNWDYNAYNSDPSLQTYYDDIYLPLSINGNAYDSTVRVEIERVLTFIDYRRQFDIYATNIGRIYSVRKNLQITNTDTLDIQKGTELIYSAVEYGIE